MTSGGPNRNVRTAGGGTARPQGGGIRSAGRRERILRAAGELIRKRGYYGTSIDDIGEAAGITGPAVYYHFESKEHLLVALAERAMERLLERLQEIRSRGQSPIETLQAFVDATVEIDIEARNLIAVYAREADHLPKHARIRVNRERRELFDEWVAVVRSCRPQLSAAESVAIAQAGLMLVTSVGYVTADIDPAKLRRLVARMAMAALLAE